MPGFVKSDKDERKWAKAKRAAQDAGATNKYAFANWWFHHTKGKSKNEVRELLASLLSTKIIQEVTSSGSIALPSSGMGTSSVVSRYSDLGLENPDDPSIQPVDLKKNKIALKVKLRRHIDQMSS